MQKYNFIKNPSIALNTENLFKNFKLMKIENLSSKK